MCRNRLDQIIREQIKRAGPITFETFMDMKVNWDGDTYAKMKRRLKRAGLWEKCQGLKGNKGW